MSRMILARQRTTLRVASAGMSMDLALITAPEASKLVVSTPMASTLTRSRVVGRMCIFL